MKRDLLKEKILQPILNLRPRSVTPEDFLEAIFNVHTRIISAYYVRQGFDIPGLYLENDTIPIQGIDTPYRRTKRGGHIIVRVDDREPEMVQVESKGHVFVMNRLEWNTIRPYLFVKKGCEEV
jgi:hypothetical protein